MGGLGQGAVKRLRLGLARFGADAGGGAGALRVQRAIRIGKRDGARGQDRDKVGIGAGGREGGGPGGVILPVVGLGADRGGKGQWRRRRGGEKLGP